MRLLPRAVTPRTLRARLTLTAVAVALLASAATTAVTGLLAHRRLDAEAAHDVLTRAQAALATVQVRADGSLKVTDTDQDELLDAGIWVFQGQQALEHPPGATALDDVATGLVNQGRVKRRHGSRLFQALPVLRSGHQVGTVVASSSLEPYRRGSLIIVEAGLGLGVLFVVLVGLLASRVAALALAPVAAMTEQASEWSAAALDARFGTAGRRPDELRELARHLDEMLDRIAAVLRREQRLSAEISHELRTPLAGIVAQVDWLTARHRSAAETGAAIEQIAESTRRMESILDSLLTAARADNQALRGRCDLAEVLPAFAPVARIDAVPVFVGVDAQIVERILAPLLDNAERHGGGVRLECRHVDGAVEIDVRDDGPGVPAGSEEEVFEPGRRLNPSDGHGGAGLGLPLARRVARSAGGDVSAVAGPGGRFVVRLPAG